MRRACSVHPLFALCSNERLVSTAEEADARRFALSSGAVPATLTEDEAAAAYLYTTNAAFESINAGLRDPARLASVEPFACLLDAALSKLPNVQERTVFRGWSDQRFDGRKGDVIRWRSFTSASEDR